jgi:hypothetical protein
MAAKTHNPTPATAQDTPIYANVTINATQAGTRRTLIGHPYEETPHQGRDDPASIDCPGTDRDLLSLGKFFGLWATQRAIFFADRVEKLTDN